MWILASLLLCLVVARTCASPRNRTLAVLAARRALRRLSEPPPTPPPMPVHEDEDVPSPSSFKDD